MKYLAIGALFVISVEKEKEMAAKKIAKKVGAKKSAPKKVPPKKTAKSLKKKGGTTNIASEYTEGQGTKPMPGVALVPVGDVHIKARLNPRSTCFNIDGLAAVMRENGMTSSLMVRPRKAGGYTLVAGERRYRAAIKAKVKMLPVIIRDDLCGDEDKSMSYAISENTNREDLNPVDLGRALKLLEKNGHSVSAISRMTGTHERTVRRLTTLMDAPKDVLDRVSEGKLGLMAGLQLATADTKVRKIVEAELPEGASANEIKLAKKKAAMQIAEATSPRSGKTTPSRNQNKSGIALDQDRVIRRGARACARELVAQAGAYLTLCEDKDNINTGLYHRLRGVLVALLWERGDIDAPEIADVTETDAKSRKANKVFDALIQAEAQKCAETVSE